MSNVVLDQDLIGEIRLIEHATGRNDVLAGFVRKLEASLAGFRAAFSEQVARGDGGSAEFAAHTLKGACRQLGALALGDLFADIERCVKSGDYAEAQRRFDDGAVLITQSLEALKQA